VEEPGFRVGSITLGEEWKEYAIVGGCLIGGMLLALLLKRILCPPKGSQCIVGSFSVLLILLGGAITALSVMAIWDVSLHVAVDVIAYELESYTGMVTLYTLLGIGVCLCLVSVGTLLGLTCGSSAALLICWIFWLIVMLAQLLAIGFTMYLLFAFREVSSDSIQTYEGTATGRYGGKLGAEALVFFEGLLCVTYQSCCRDPALDLPLPGSAVAAHNRTCLQSHGGTLVDLALIVEDPSSGKFCEYATGSTDVITPSKGVCVIIDTIRSPTECRSNFCILGAQGYYTFVKDMLSVVIQYAAYIAAAVCVGFAFQSTLLVNLWSLRKRSKMKMKTQPVTDTTPPVTDTTPPVTDQT